MIINLSGKEKRLPFDDQGGAHPDDQKQWISFFRFQSEWQFLSRT
jgi:hypothetical protein